jgi:glycosyltransferase involved in cell wall biosynthesis
MAAVKLLWISQNLPFPPKTGVLQRNYNLIREASRFADVHLLAILKQDILPGFDAAVAERELATLCRRVQVVRLPIEESKLRFLAVVVWSLFTRAPFTANWASSPVLRNAVAQALDEGPFDAVYFDTISLAGYRPMVGPTPSALNHHNIESHLFERRLPYERHPLKRFYFGLEAGKLRRYEAEVGHSFETHLVVSRLDGERLQAICPGVSTSVVANGVNVDYFTPGAAPPEKGHLVMVSGMNWFPNRDMVLYFVGQIWPALSAKRQDLKLTIVGASPPEEVTALAARDTRVTVTGWVDDVRPFMERAQVYLCPMRDGGGTRLKILDALAMGKAIVATTMALEGIDVVPERDVLVADDPSQFVAQVVRLVDDPDLAPRVGASGRDFAVQHFSWPVIGARMEQTFRSLASAGPRHA